MVAGGEDGIELFTIRKVAVFLFDLFCQPGKAPILVVYGPHRLSLHGQTVRMKLLHDALKLGIAHILHDHQRMGQWLRVLFMFPVFKQLVQCGFGLGIAEKADRKLHRLQDLFIGRLLCMLRTEIDQDHDVLLDL